MSCNYMEKYPLSPKYLPGIKEATFQRCVDVPPMTQTTDSKRGEQDDATMAFALNAILCSLNDMHITMECTLESYLFYLN